MMDPTVRRVEQALRNPVILFGAILLLTIPVGAAVWLLFPHYRDFLSDPFWFPLIVMASMLGLILSSTAICILAERKLAGFTQDRRGPNRVGFWGLLQPMADGLKFFLKEDITPANVDKPLFLLAPAISMMTALIGFAVVPWAGEVRWPWMETGTVRTQVVSIDIGVLYVLAVGSVGVYGIVLAGYASNNKYSFFGGMRAAAQMISYELPMGLSLLCVLLVVGTLRPEEIVRWQAETGLWLVFMYPLPFLLFLVSAFAEANRAPFDLAEAEQELVGGFHTEYSSMKFAMFFLGEYAHMITGSAIVTALFLGGWAPIPFMSWYSEVNGVVEPTWWNIGWVAMLIKLGVYLGKVAVLIGVFMWVRWTLPRFRFDQLMRLAWQSMVPLGVVLIIAIALLVAFDLQRNFLAALGVNIALLIVMLVLAAQTKEPITGRQADLPQIEIRPTA